MTVWHYVFGYLVAGIILGEVCLWGGGERHRKWDLGITEYSLIVLLWPALVLCYIKRKLS